MWDFLLQFKYENYLLMDEEEVLLKAKVDNLLENLTPRIEGPVEIKIEQNSKKWLNERRLRIIASECKSFFMSKDLTNLVKKKLWSGEIDISHLPQLMEDYTKMMLFSNMSQWWTYRSKKQGFFNK